MWWGRKYVIWGENSTVFRWEVLENTVFEKEGDTALGGRERK